MAPKFVVLPLTAMFGLVNHQITPAFAFHPVSMMTRSRTTPCHRTSSFYGRTACTSCPRSFSTLVLLESSSNDMDTTSVERIEDSFEYSREPDNKRPTVSQRSQSIDPLVAAFTRIDETTSSNSATTNIPFFGEIPIDGNLLLFVPAAVIGILGFVFSIVVAFNSKDVILQELSHSELPQGVYRSTVMEEELCRGLCSNQDSDFEKLREFLGSFSKGD